MGDVVGIRASSARSKLLACGLRPLVAADWTQAVDRDAALAELCQRRDVSQTASLVWVEAPHLQQAALRLIEYLTLRFPSADGRQTVVEDAIVNAIDSYARAGRRGQGRDREVVFLSRLVECADQVVESQALALDPDGSQRCWDAWQQSLPDWLRQGQYQEFFVRKRERRSTVERLGARTALASKLVGHRELGMLEMFRRHTARAGL